MKRSYLRPAVISCALLALSARAQTNTFPASGNVGIGTTAPDATLQIVSASGDATLHVNANSGSTMAPVIRLQKQGANKWGWLGEYPAPGKMSIYSYDMPGNVLVAADSGNVGIGTSSPVSRLHVAAPQAILVIQDVSSAASSNAVANYISFRDSSGQEYGWMGDGSGNTNRISLFGGSNHSLSLGAGGAERLLIDVSGNTGIGTATPVAKLHVNGQIAGGFGANTTGGVTDWNDVTNSRSGNGYSLLHGDMANGPGPSAYFHPFNFEYGSKDGSGSITQFAIPYADDGAINKGVWMRGRYWNNPWGPWVKLISENTSGNVGIGTLTPTHKLSVNGTGKFKEVIVETTGWSDYVFAPDYELQPLSEVESHILQHQHLPGIPSAKEVAEQGVSIGEMQAKLLAKIEELTLHAIEHQKLQTDFMARDLERSQMILQLAEENRLLKERLDKLEGREND